MSERNERRHGRGPMGGGPPHMRGPGEKPKNFKKTMGKLIRHCRKYLPAMLIALVAAAAGTVLQIIGPDWIKSLTNEISKGLPALVNGVPVANSIDMTAVANICWTLVFFYAGAMLLNFIQSFIMATVTQKVSRGLRTDISKKINRLPLRYFDQTSYGDVLSRVTNDVDTIGQTMNQSVSTLVTSITMFFGALFMMFYNSSVSYTHLTLPTKRIV